MKATPVLLALLFPFCAVLGDFYSQQAHAQSLDQVARPVCGPGQILIKKPEGYKCKKDRRKGRRQRPQDNVVYDRQPATTSTSTTTERGEEGEVFFIEEEHGVSLSPEVIQRHPLPYTRYLNLREEMCLAQKQVYWPSDGHCHTLLMQGPCGQNEWLVLEERLTAFEIQVDIVCKPRPCPCTVKEPYLCEILVPSSDSCDPQCRVALAAEQDGVCPRGEQLLIDPFGIGKCGCRKDPHHKRWPGDGRCYELFTQGPCPSNQTLQYSAAMDEPICVPEICPQDMVLYEDGRCYTLYSRGPCDEHSLLTLATEELEPTCTLMKHHKIKRIFDMAPKNVREERERNNILGNLRVQMTPRGNRSHKKNQGSIYPLFHKRGENPESSLESRSARAKLYLLWLRSHVRGSLL